MKYFKSFFTVVVVILLFDFPSFARQENSGNWNGSMQDRWQDMRGNMQDRMNNMRDR